MPRRCVAESFRGKTRVQQHQMVYEALKGEMGGELHALALQTGTPERRYGSRYRTEQALRTP